MADKVKRAFETEPFSESGAQANVSRLRVEPWLQGRACTETLVWRRLGLGCASEGLGTWKDVKPRSDVSAYCVFQYGSPWSQAAIEIK